MSNEDMATMPVADLVKAIRGRDWGDSLVLGLVMSVMANRLEGEHGRVVALEAELRRCRVFITSREKMHPDGVALFDELLEASDANSGD